MIAIPAKFTRAALEEELPSAENLCHRLGWVIKPDLDAETLDILIPNKKWQKDLLLVGDFHGYRQVPPAWRFLNPQTRQDDPVFRPAGGPLPVGGKSLIFHADCICAPFNRLAYSDNGGPHGNWGGPESWLTFVDPANVRAVNLAEMLQVFRIHLLFSPGTKA